MKTKTNINAQNRVPKLGDISYETTTTFSMLSKAAKKDPYRDSKFKDLVHLSSSAKGAKIEYLVEDLLKRNGIEVKPAKNTQHDRVIAGRHAEIKGSSLWKDGKFTWQQIRPKEKDWDCVYFVAIYPDRIDVFFDSRKNVLAYPNLRPQHNGKAGKDTMWLHQCEPEDFPTWQLIGSIV